MTSIDFKKNTREYFLVSTKSPAFIVGALLLIPILVLLPVNRAVSDSRFLGYAPCLADCFSFCYLTSFNDLIVLLFSFYMMNLQKHNFSVPFVIRQRSRPRLWLKQCYYILLSALLFALYIALCIVVIGYAATGKAINWSEADSYYYTCFDMVSPMKSVLPVIGLFVGVCALTFVVMGMLVLCLHWLTNSVLPGYMLVCAIPIYDSYSARNLTIFYRRCNVMIYQWFPSNSIFRTLTYPVLWIAVLYLLGRVISKRKEFFDVHQRN